MKKLALTLSFILALSGTTFAYYLEDETPEIDTLRAQGYSESTIQTVDLITCFNKGKNKKNSKTYTSKRGKNALGRSYTAIRNYFDPMQDDGKFGQHQIEFSNTWNNDLPEYANRYNSNYNAENL